ncbi:MAG TPA: hypothetical protein VEZ90_00035, partial [Blastocatellia bacterium]|nr:hypothetical protein [Blastocatellia bacterium]
MPLATPDTPLVLDNDLFSHWRNRHKYIERALGAYFAYHQQYPALPSMTVFESLSGFLRDDAGEIEATVGDKFERAQHLIDELVVLPFDRRAAEIAAAVFRRLPDSERRGLT